MKTEIIESANGIYHLKRESGFADESNRCDFALLSGRDTLEFVSFWQNTLASFILLHPKTISNANVSALITAGLLESQLSALKLINKNPHNPNKLIGYYASLLMKYPAISSELSASGIPSSGVQIKRASLFFAPIKKLFR